MDGGRRFARPAGSRRPNVMRKQRGVALITVMLTVAVLLVVVANLMTRHSLVISQNRNTFEQTQALQYALGAETLARQILFEDFSADPHIHHLGEIWAQPVMPFELDEGGFLEAQVRDLHGCYNINNAWESGAEPLTRLRRLFTNIGVQPQLADLWKDWVDSDADVTGYGAEDSEYLINEIPHRTPNTMVQHVSEMFMLNNATREEIELILPEVCVVPTDGLKINVNTATGHTLAALDDGIAPSIAESMGVREYSSTADFGNDYQEFAPPAIQNLLTVKSEYFLLHAYASVGDTSVTLLSTLHRDPDNGEITVLSRDFGKLFRSNLTVDVEDS